ncbi:MAG: hypothetical protein HS103_03075 [Anaerolineales bacterium]|nr:hypothetical protein [Anaerolineales bacterium]
MSALCGFVCWDRQPALDGFQAMIGALAHRGTAQTWITGGVHLAAFGEDASLRIESDPPSLFLAVSSTQPHSVLYEGLVRWGTETAQHIPGEYSAALWDAPTERLTLTHDHFGARPVYYYACRSFCAFATELGAILALPDVPRRIDESHLAAYLLNLDTETLTFYRDIALIPCGGSVEIGAAERTPQVRVTPLPPMEGFLRLPDDRAYEEAFREHFAQAVRRRMGEVFASPPQPIGTHLSGGLDSSLITVMARSILSSSKAAEGGSLHAFHLVPPNTPERDERPFARAVAATGGLIHHEVAEGSAFDHLDRLLQAHGQPIFSMNGAAHLALNRAAHDLGVRVMLDGEDGDGVLSHGWTYLDELAAQGDWDAFLREAKAAAALRGTTAHAYLYKTRDALAHFLKRGRLAAYLKGMQMLRRGLGKGTTRRLAKNTAAAILKPRQSDPLYGWRKRLLANDRLLTIPRWKEPAPRMEHLAHHQGLGRARRAILLAEIDAIGGAAGIAMRHPFYDLDLVRFCLALPPEQKMRSGVTRSLARRALAEMLPESVRARLTKSDFALSLVHDLLTTARPFVDRLFDSDLEGFVSILNLDEVRHLAGRIRGLPDYRAYEAGWESSFALTLIRRMVIAAHWLG